MDSKVLSNDYFGRFRTIISDPVNVLIHRVPLGRTEIQNLNSVEISTYVQDSIKILGIL